MSTKLMSPGGIEQNLKTVKLKLFHVLRISSVRGIEPSNIEQHKCKAKAKSSDMSTKLVGPGGNERPQDSKLNSVRC